MLFTPQSDMGRPLRLGTRGSPLALAQARMTAQASFLSDLKKV